MLADLAVLLAASGMFALESRWLDLTVATFIASLALTGGLQVVREAQSERSACVRSTTHVP